MVYMASQQKALLGIGGAILAVAATLLGVDLTHDSGSANKNSEAKSSTSVLAPVSPAKGVTANQDARQTAQETQSKTKDGMKVCPVDSLPDQAKVVISDIKKGGPFKYPDNDGVHFGNFASRLPKSDNYREYTVDTPGLKHRGARRIVTNGRDAKNPTAWYYTQDHYDSFCEIPDAK